MPLLFLVDRNRPNPSKDAVYGLLVVTGFDHQLRPTNRAATRGPVHFFSDVHLIEVELEDTDDAVIIRAGGVDACGGH